MLRRLTSSFLILLLVSYAVRCLAQTREGAERATMEDDLKTFLQNYVGEPTSSDAKDTRYYVAFVDLQDNGSKDALVYLTGNGWCGSGGCTTLVLMPSGPKYVLVTKIIITRPPIRVLRTKSNGWHDLVIHVQGGGVVHGYDAKLQFDGKSYPISPTVPPAKVLTTKAGGTVAVPLTALIEGGRPLYP